MPLSGLIWSFNTNTNLEFIPNMDGFPNGRRLEDDVTRIELQGSKWCCSCSSRLIIFDDYVIGNNPLPKLLGVLGYTTGIEQNDTNFRIISICTITLERLRSVHWWLRAYGNRSKWNTQCQTPDLLMTSYRTQPVRWWISVTVLAGKWSDN